MRRPAWALTRRTSTAGVQKVAEGLGLKCDDIKAVLIEGEWVGRIPESNLRPPLLIPVVWLWQYLIGLLEVRLLDSMVMVEQVVSANGLAAFQVIENGRCDAYGEAGNERRGSPGPGPWLATTCCRH